MNQEDFRKHILAGIPDALPAQKPFDASLNHAPKRKDILNAAEKKNSRSAMHSVTFLHSITACSHLNSLKN
jgi:urocanate hydratase